MRDKAFNIAKTPKYDGYQRGLGSVVYQVFDKKTSSSRAPSDILRSETLAITEFAGSGIKNENVSNKELAEEFHKPVIRKF